MSQITENTIVMPTAAEATFLQQVMQYETAYRISGLVRIHTDAEITIYVFDCNGDNPWMHENLNLPWLILEINYLDGDGPYTMLPDGDADSDCATLLSHYLSGDCLREVVERISYSG